MSSGQIQLEVIDHGKGISLENQPAPLTGTPSLGVGIPGMRERLRQLGGQLDVQFDINGTRVIASLPVDTTAMPGAAETGTDVSAGQSPGTRLSAAANADARKRILIADDHEVMRRGVRGLLEGHEEWAICGEAVEGREAVRKTRELRPDLLILDINMPGISGIDAAIEILKNEPACRILFFTVHDSAQVLREIASVGAQGYVSKARAGKDLVDAVRIVLEGGKFFPAFIAT